MLRSSQISFHRARSATVARNVIHDFQFSRGSAVTQLQTAYERPIRAHAIRDWITGHPRIVLPILFFFLGTLTYTVRWSVSSENQGSLSSRYSIPFEACSWKGRCLTGSTFKVCHLARCCTRSYPVQNTPSTSGCEHKHSIRSHLLVTIQIVPFRIKISGKNAKLQRQL